MRLKLLKYKLKTLFCFHLWDRQRIDYQYVDFMNNIVLVWRCKCEKCGKIKFKKMR